MPRTISITKSNFFDGSNKNAKKGLLDSVVWNSNDWGDNDN